ncbi:DUF4129 domain-containing protein [uncultured Hymenobacter sp.]|uniref:DUF4129 domain-containing protein n=1 Tax=uncultured Hymenobacter sp. TaxID=170016 RepID=UPI0035CBF8B9
MRPAAAAFSSRGARPSQPSRRGPHQLAGALAFLGLTLSLALAPPAAAGPGPTPPDSAQATAALGRRPLPPDLTAPLPPRPADAARLRELRQQREFTYVEAAPEAASAWDLFWRRVGQALRRWLASRSYEGFWRWVFYALFLGAAVFIVLKLLQVDVTGAFGRSARPVPLGYDTLAENIHEVDFQARLAEAEAVGNHRLALRLGYLQLLKRLADHGLIAWQPDKTNHAYLAELPAAGPLRPAFGELTRQFEYVWYGELPLPASLYAEARAGQQALSRELGEAG